MTPKTPFSGKAKKQQLQEKRERNRQRRGVDSEDEEAATEQQASAIAPVPAPVGPATSGRGDLRTIFQHESKRAIEARKRDATRLLVYAPDRGHSQAIYAYGIHEPSNQLPILVKPKWSHGMTPEELIEAEDEAYKGWIQDLDAIQEERGIKYNLFERNIEVWRQLWRTIERSDVLVHLADARCPVLHLSDQLIQYTFIIIIIIIILSELERVAGTRAPSDHRYIHHSTQGQEARDTAAVTER